MVIIFQRLKLPGIVNLVLLLLMVSMPAFSQQEHLQFKRFTIDDGLSENLIYSIAEDHQGFMWFGTQDGLNRFDGYGFTAFHHDPFDTASLSDNAIIVLFTDSKGRFWVGTARGGLNLYDPKRNIFIHFLTDPTDSGMVSGDYVESITEDVNGNLWVGTFGNGLFEFIFSQNDQSGQPKKIVHYVHQPGDSTSLSHNYILSVFADSEGRLWLSYMDGPMQMALLNEERIQFITPKFTVREPKQIVYTNEIQFDLKHPKKIKNKMKIGSGQVTFMEKQHQLWMGMGDGLYLLNNKSDTVIRFNFSQPWAPQGSVLSICNGPAGQDTTHSLWVGTYYGLQILNTTNYRLRLIKSNPLNKESLVDGRILKIYKDKSGCVWLGSNGNGLSKYDFHSNIFSSRHFFSPGNKEITDDLSVLSMFDNEKYLLLGTFTGLWKMNKKTQRLNLVLENAAKNVSIGTDDSVWPELVFDIISADSGKLWIAGSNGLIYYDPESDKSILYSTRITTNGMDDNTIIKLYDDNHGHLWALTRHTFSIFNKATKTFTNYYYDYKISNVMDELPHGNIYRDAKGNFWLGGKMGLLYFNTDKKDFQRFVNNPGDNSSLSFNMVECIIPDPQYPDKYLWIGTVGGGLNRFDLETKKFMHYGIQNGLPNNTIHGIIADKSGFLWISTNKGISKFNPRDSSFHNYDIRQGLPNDEFNPGSYYSNAEGKLFFGSIHGFIAFDPDNIKENKYTPPVVFTDFRLFNKSVSSKDRNSPLKGSITDTKQIVLSYKDNIISFQVAALNYSNTDQTEYEYRLNNFNEKWISNGTDRLITFSNLSPGHYTLLVKAANGDGVWSGKTTSMNIIILPPWWRTWWAYAFYVLVLASVLFYLRKYELKRMHFKSRLRVERIEAQKLKELDHSKSRFFANISHEFRTPLTLIIGPVEDLLRDKHTQKFRESLQYIHRNSKRLLQLINQLLDLSKLDVRNYKVNTCRDDIISFVKQIVHSFSSMAHHKSILLETEVDPRLKNNLKNETLTFYFDDDIFEKILYNLLSNAFKFTSEGGSITVSISLADKSLLELKVEDSGTGIPVEKLPFIFDRFYQADDSHKKVYEGTGIGLALVKELVELHNGTITVESDVNKGTSFCCYFEFNKKIISEGVVGKMTSNKITVLPVVEYNDAREEKATGLNKPVILVVEDQQDVRNYICDKLKETYTVAEAKNGQEGFETAKKEMPDLVISDVMMPITDGFELCTLLKNDIITSHIPVILLTARAEDADKITGLENGADAYLVKPFNSKELLIRVYNLIELRNTLRKKFSGKLIVKPEEITVTSQDNRFMKQLLGIVEKHITDEKFSVEQLGREFAMSSSQINRKLKAIINQSAGAFIRSVRMERAMELLKNNQASIAEIAYETGFNEPAYFSRVFKSYFGYAPSDVKKTEKP